MNPVFAAVWPGDAPQSQDVAEGYGEIFALRRSVRIAGETLPLSVPLTVPHPDSPSAETPIPKPPVTLALSELLNFVQMYRNAGRFKKSLAGSKETAGAAKLRAYLVDTVSSTAG